MYAFVVEIEDAVTDVVFAAAAAAVVVVLVAAAAEAVVAAADVEFSGDKFVALVPSGSDVQTVVALGLAAAGPAAVVAFGVASSWPHVASVGAHVVADGHALVD